MLPHARASCCIGNWQEDYSLLSCACVVSSSPRFLTGEVKIRGPHPMCVGDLSESEWSTTGLTTPWISRRRNGRSAVPMCTWGFPTPNLGFQLGATACLGSGGCHQTPCPQQNSKAQITHSNCCCWYHHQHATNMVWPLRAKKNAKQEQFFISRKKKKQWNSQKKGEGNANK